MRKNKAMNFDIVSNDLKSNARAGILHTGHGPIETPIFMPVGTAGTVKACHIRDVRDEVKAQIILGNTYHLYLRPAWKCLRLPADCTSSTAGTDQYLRIAVVFRCFR